MLIFWVVREVKGQKMVQNDKKLFSFVLHISGAIHDMFLIMIRVCKMIISPGDFFIFSKFCFFGLLGCKRAKKWPQMTKNYVCLTPYIRTYLVHMCKMISSAIFFIFQNSDFLCF